ncbi:sulfurtransferase [Kineococcus rhizosphaerae]|uniref:Thiosulfate/3-mercaptopyruvate sulfurtransferase n=1 Tax=Kineococcus rhizosphaerae TaxID=559628 RepID=A0A2T0RAD2_9ACTN|nr:sulfurtransferase [Kineococcus rhizosphaerae]PRY18090.1 thiosulfate/3-mercaptopyruvate sulfurtransferase [Kineococcus rhizosphaerae]
MVLTSAAELHRDLTGPTPPVLLDVRWALGGPDGAQEYAAGHLPGAVYVDLDTQLSRPRRPGEGRHPLPDPAALQEVLRDAGVSAGSRVVVYDAATSTSAARGWWVLRWAGIADVRVLDGGLAAWVAAGGDLSTDVPLPEPGDVVVHAGSLPVLDAAAVADLARTGLVLDARAPERYRGEVEPVDPVAGHVPGAVNAPTTQNVDTAGTFLPPDALRERFAALGVRDGAPGVGVYCGSGVTAAHTLLALEVAGLTGVLYPGSWSEWVADPSRPVATGGQPG